MFKKNWFPSWPLKSSTNKQLHSLDNLKTLYNVLFKNQTVTEQNKHLLVETLRSIAEILIWGDQNDSTVFDFFLEKNMLSFFLKIMKQQRCGSYVCVQLLQTLNILFENIRDETSLYYLLSNNHVNSIIIHKFDFSDEEVMAYYISFLKTLSFKLNDHTIHFFYNENTNDFPLYTEAIKFFNHQEKMVRIAVRTISLNVFRIEEQSMLKFVSDHTAVPYFSNLVWFIGNHILEIDNCLKKEIKDQQMLIKLDDLVAEHLDHLHYLNDILLLRINNLNEILTDHLLNRLLIPLYIYSLIYDDDYNYDNFNQFNNSNSNLISNTTISTTSYSNSNQNQNSLFSLSSINQSPIHYTKQQSTISSSTYKDRPKISKIVSLFLLSQIFLIISYDSLVQQLINLILYGNFNIFDKPQFIAPLETLEESLVNNLLNRSSSSKLIYDTDNYNDDNNDDNDNNFDNNDDNSCDTNDNNCDNNNRSLIMKNNEINNLNKIDLNDHLIDNQNLLNKNDSDLNKSLKDDLNKQNYNQSNSEQIQNLLIDEFLKDKPFLEVLFNSFDCTIQKDDHLTVFSLSLLYAIIFNTGIEKSQIKIFKNDDYISSTNNKDIKLITDQLGSSKLIDHLTQIINLSGNFDSFIRPITLELCSLLLIKLCIQEVNEDNERINKIRLSDHHLAIIEQTKENSTSVVRNYYRNENEQLFLDLFEDEFMEFSKFKINVEYLMMDANLLIPPNQLQPLMLNNLHFTRRLPFSDIEKARYALRVFFIIRNLSMKITNEKDDNQLPLTNIKNLVSVNDNIDLNNCNLVHCFLQIKNQNKEEGYIVILDEQLVFIEPDNQRGIGSVSAKYTANLQNIDVYLDKDDSRSLLVTIRPNAANGSQTKFGAIDLNNLKTTSSKHSNTNLKLLFDDYIRCKVTEQHITKGKHNVIQRKLRKIANLIDIELDNNQIQQSNSNSLLNFNNQSHHQPQSTKQRNHLHRTLRYSNSSSNGLPIPGVAKMTFKSTTNQSTNQNRSSNLISSLSKKTLINRKSSSLSSTSSQRTSNKNSCDNSPKTEKIQNLKQEICEMKDLSPKNQRKKFTINLPSKTINLEETSD